MLKDRISKIHWEYWVLGLLCVVGFICTWGYGIYLDQDLEQKILYSNVLEYLSLLPGKLSGMGKEIADSGIVGIRIFEERDHGIAVYYPVSFVWHLYKSNAFVGNLVWKTYTCLVCMAGFLAFYKMGKKVFSNPLTSFFTTLFFVLTPRIFAEAHYNNKDMILLAMLLLLTYVTSLLREKITVKRMLLFALFGALAFNTKIIGLFFVAMMGLYLIVDALIHKKATMKFWIQALTCVVLMVVFFVILTPSAWGGIVEHCKYCLSYAVNFSRWNNFILYNGTKIHHDYTGMPRKYLPIMMLLTVPVAIWVLLGIACIVMVYVVLKKKAWWKEEKYLFGLLVGATGFIPLMYAILSATPLYNGWRHFYFVYVSVMIMVGLAIEFLLNCSLKKVGLVSKVVMTLVLSYLAIGIMMNYPQEYAYYNFLAGEEVELRFETDYWEVSTREAFDIVEKDCDTDKCSVGVIEVIQGWGIDEQYEASSKKLQDKIEITREWQNADYVIVNLTYAFLYSEETYQYIVENYELVDTVYSYGNRLNEVWRKNN